MPYIPAGQMVWTVNGYQVQLPPMPEQVVADPTATLKGVPGQQVINTVNQSIWEYTGTQWLVISNAGGGAGAFANLTVNPGPTDLTGALTVTTGVQDTNIGADNSTGDINIGTVGVRDVVLGSVSGGASTVVRGGAGGTIVASTGVTNITTTRANADALLINASDALGGITLSAAGNTVNTALSAVGEVHTLTNLPFTVATGSGAVTLSGDNSNNTVNLGTGTGASVKTVNLGSTIGASATTINSGTGGIALSTGAIAANAGSISVAPLTATFASPTAAATMDRRVGRVTFTGFTTAGAGTQAFTITNATVIANSGIFVTVQNLNASGNGAMMTLTGVTTAVGSFIVNTTNSAVAALGAGDNVIITFWVIS